MLERAKIEVAGLGGSYGPESYTLFEMLPEMGPPLVHRTQSESSDDSWRLESSRAWPQWRATDNRHVDRRCSRHARCR